MATKALVSAAHRRIISLQRRIHDSIKEEVRRALGSQSKVIRRYYEAYKREFRANFTLSSREELLNRCRKSDVILMGDYHTFSHSQKAASRMVLDLLEWEEPLAIALEMIPAENQKDIDSFLAGDISEKELLARTSYAETWGFPWERYRPFLLIAKEHGLPVIALNIPIESLEKRDEQAGRLLAEFCERNPDRKLFVFYGDLHLARGHIPRSLKRELKGRGRLKKILTVFQNSETLYWRLAAQGSEHTANVLKCGSRRFCVMNAAPWVKLQSYLEWTESHALLESDDQDGQNLHDVVHDRLKNLAQALGLKLPNRFDFTVQSMDDLAAGDLRRKWDKFDKQERKTVEYLIPTNRAFYFPAYNLAYVGLGGVNSVCEAVSWMVLWLRSGVKPAFHKSQIHTAILSATLVYFGSKLLNHRRKCDLEDDFRLLLATNDPRRQKLALTVVAHCNAQREYLRTGVYRVPRTNGDFALLAETTRALGEMLGERLYAGYIGGDYHSEKISKLYTGGLLESESARALYLQLIQDLESTPRTHTSKEELL